MDTKQPEKDNLELALEIIHQTSPDDLTNANIIITKTNLSLLRAEGNYYTKVIAHKIAKKHRKEIFEVNSNLIKHGTIKFNPDDRFFLEKNTKEFLEVLLKQNRKKIIVFNFNDLGLTFSEVIPLITFLILISTKRYKKQLLFVFNINLDLNNQSPLPDNAQRKIRELKEKDFSDPKTNIKPKFNLKIPVNTNHYHLEETRPENERIDFMMQKKQESVTNILTAPRTQKARKLIAPTLFLH